VMYGTKYGGKWTGSSLSTLASHVTIISSMLHIRIQPFNIDVIWPQHCTASLNRK